jgi:signal transduction histidine kinase
LLALPDDNPQRRSRVTARMMNSVGRMERMIGDLLDLTRARMGGSLALTRQPTDLRRVCDEVLLEIAASHPEATMQFDVSGDVRGEWDADRLAQVVSNLVGNAIQHGDQSPITLAAHEHADVVTLTVHNGGPPIAPKLLPLVFEPLTRGDRDPEKHSIGLGLFITRAILAAHGGSIEVSSSADAGTTFTVTLPKA